MSTTTRPTVVPSPAPSLSALLLSRIRANMPLLRWNLCARVHDYVVNIVSQEVEVLKLCKSIVEDGPDLFSLHKPSVDAPFRYRSICILSRFSLFIRKIKSFFST